MDKVDQTVLNHNFKQVSDSTWEPAESLDCPDLFEAFKSQKEAVDNIQVVTVFSYGNTTLPTKAVSNIQLPSTTGGCPRKRKTSKLEPVCLRTAGKAEVPSLACYQLVSNIKAQWL